MVPTDELNEILWYAVRGAGSRVPPFVRSSIEAKLAAQGRRLGEDDDD